MHGFFNAGYLLILGLFSLIASMAFWFRDVISEGTWKSLPLKDLPYNYTLNIAKASCARIARATTQRKGCCAAHVAISKEELKQALSSYLSSQRTTISSLKFSNDQLGY